jgi:hypothetical protein
MHVESGEEALGEIATVIAARLGLGTAQSWYAEEAAWGRNMAVFSLGSNSRVVRGKRARDLGWSPTQRSVTRWSNELDYSLALLSRTLPGQRDLGFGGVSNAPRADAAPVRCMKKTFETVLPKDQ